MAVSGLLAERAGNGTTDRGTVVGQCHVFMGDVGQRGEYGGELFLREDLRSSILTCVALDAGRMDTDS